MTKKKRKPLHPLKRVRLVVEIGMVLAVSALFLFPGAKTASALAPWITPLQFIPAILKLVGAVTLGVIGLLAVVVLTVLFGRVYCSTICPLGAYQDLFIRWRRSFRDRRWFRFGAPPAFIHYSVLALVVATALGGSFVLLNLLEPFSDYGRGLSVLGDPVVTAVNNATAFVLGRMGFFVLPALPWRVATVTAMVIPGIVLLGVGALAVWRGRFFCNSLCPAGAVLSLISRISVFRLAIDHGSCNECGLCEMVCKAECIDAGSKRIDVAACVGCFNCLDACPSIAMKWESVWTRESPAAGTNEGRRALLGALLAPFAGTLSDSTSTSVPALSFDASRGRPVAPPGAVSVDRFSSLCTACHLCVSACPTQVIYPSVFEYGIAGVFQPRMNYAANYCNYDCTVCGQVCPTGALRPLPLDEKKLTQLGQAKFVRDDCIVITKKTDCGACSEHCPTKAVHMVREDRLFVPELKGDLCIGCGACEHACPTRPRKAIYVVGLAVHGLAKKPELKPVESPAGGLQEFPF